MPKVLVTAIGSFSSDIVIKKLHPNGYFVVGTDIYPREWVVAAWNVDKFYRVPKASEGEEYIRRLWETCKENEIDFLFPLTDPETYLFQPYIPGNILTVDIVRDRFGNCCAVARRELIRTLVGAGISVRVFRDHALERSCKEIAELLNVVGCVNFEFIEADDGKRYFLECNPRFSGGVAFSVLAGYDFVTNHLRCFKNEEIETTAEIEEHYISRKYEECITD